MAVLLRSRQLLQTSRRVIREKGIVVFVSRVWKWLAGERGYHRTLSYSSVSYTAYWRSIQPTSDELDLQRQQAAEWKNPPHFGLITCFTHELKFHQTWQSVLEQNYSNWEWLIPTVDSQALSNYLRDSRVSILPIQNEAVIENLNAALQAVQADYIFIVNEGDRLASNALYAAAKVIQANPQIDVIYFDSDHMSQNGEHLQPFFKPDWSPEIMLSVNLLEHCVVRQALLERVGCLEPTSAYQWDWGLRLSEVAAAITHIPEILYHCSSDSHRDENEALDDRAKGIQAHLERIGLVKPRVWFESPPSLHSVYPLCRWEIPRPRQVSIVIPSRDHSALLEQCLNSIFTLTDYDAYQVIVVDTGSQEAATVELYQKYADEKRFRLLHYTEPFNFSRACNFGAAHAQGELLLFLNNDTQVLDGDWLRGMAQWFECPSVGVVGAKLLYPDGRIQHNGVIVGINGLADNFLVYENENVETLFGSDCWYRNLLAVTGACLMISRQVFEEVGGFNEAFRLNFSDVDLCLAVYSVGYRIVYTPHVRLIHHESATHRKRQPHLDIEYASRRFADWLSRGDPYYNPNLSYASPRPILNRGLNDTPAYYNREVLGALKTPHDR